MINDLISNSKTIKKKSQNYFLGIWLQSSQHKHNSDGINPTLISLNQKKKKAICIGELESIAPTKKESNSMNEREREIMTYLIKWGPPLNAWFSLRFLWVQNPRTLWWFTGSTIGIGIILWFIIIKLIDRIINILLYSTLLNI